MVNRERKQITYSENINGYGNSINVDSDYITIEKTGDLLPFALKLVEMYGNECPINLEIDLDIELTRLETDHEYNWRIKKEEKIEEQKKKTAEASAARKAKLALNKEKKEYENYLKLKEKYENDKKDGE